MSKTNSAVRTAKVKDTVTRNTVAFRKNLICLPSGGNDPALAMSVISELMQFGFLPTTAAQAMLTNAPREEVIKFHDEVLAYLKDVTGANRSYQPLFKGFPKQVMEMSEHELWVHQILHYITWGKYDPTPWTEERPTAFEQPKYTLYDVTDEAGFKAIFKSLVSVNNSLTPQDLEDVKWFAANISDLPMPNKIPFKETLTTLASLGLNVPVKTPTDVLRIAVALSGGDVSLPAVPKAAKIAKNSRRWGADKTSLTDRDKFKFRKFNRAERKYILGLLEKSGADASEAVLKDQRWIRLGEILHPGEYRRQFPKSVQMFTELRNDKVKSWYGKLENAFKTSFEEGMKVVTERPGEFVRRLDQLIRNYESKTDVIMTALAKVGDRVSNKVLFETYTHFEGRNLPKPRTVMIKGARSRTKLADLPALSEKTITAVQNTITSILATKFSALESLGKTWIDEGLKKIPVPTNMRSLGESLVPTVRGERTAIGNQNAKVIRAYVHWFDTNGSIDIDLSSQFLGIGKIEHLSWNTRPLSKPWGCHSGDIIRRPGACAEYIDIDVKASLRLGFKYVVMTASNYSGQGLHNVKDCVFGWMEREHPESNKTFKPDTLANSVKLQSTSNNTLVAVIDIETQEYIFLDIDFNGIPVATANIDGILEAIKPYCEPPKFSVYDLLLMHVEARGSLVENKDDAVTAFNYDDFSGSYVKTLELMGI